MVVGSTDILDALQHREEEMRTMLRWTVPVETGNQAIKDGTLGPMLEALSQQLNPEAAYFWPEDGKRAGLMVFDMADPSEIPQIAEQLFMNFNAAVQFTPVMNTDDLQRGLAKASS
jgi:hypothetical protein